MSKSEWESLGMNEWNRLAEISNNTQSYLSTPTVKTMLYNGAHEMAKVEATRRQQAEKMRITNHSFQPTMPRVTLPSEPAAVELPSGDLPAHPPDPSADPVPYPGPPRPHLYAEASQDDKFAIISSGRVPAACRRSHPAPPLRRRPVPLEQRAPQSRHALPPPALPSDRQAPPLPPKTPIRHSAHFAARREHSDHGYQHNGPHTAPPTAAPGLPYPDDGPPPAVNMA
ncbi:hypothetical protein ABVK25_012470 [Lepraria finkii]|uniref:Uncharacterized protein n=1 Tax=Lepraria finkii TaxID=1340010 RepID=A0ABR4AF44_9LECA